MGEANPCMQCGACCAHFRIMLYPDEVAPLGGVPRALTNPVGTQAFCMKGTDAFPPRCIALEGEVGQGVRCTIYADRPLVCREFSEYELDGSPNSRCFKLRGMVPPVRM
ncbi:MAG: YkgJ family cysteine cluster protein [Pseudomonadota bacterium]